MFDTLRRDFQRNRDPIARVVLMIFRFGQWTAARRSLTRRVCAIPYKILNILVVRLGTNNDLPSETKCGPGLRLFHPNGIVLHARAQLGNDVNLYHRVTIGQRDFSGEPIIGDEVTIGAGATILGAVVIGEKAKIAAGAVVIDNVPDGGTALGPRASVRHPKSSIIKNLDRAE